MSVAKKMKVQLCLLLGFAGAAFGQETGGIIGMVVDKSTGNPMPGVNVTVLETDRSEPSDVKGWYLIKDLPAGTYKVQAKAQGFATLTIEKVVVVADEMTDLDLELSPAILEGELVVTADLIANTEVGLLKHRQKSISISDAISGQEISRAGGGSAADAVTKITGASVVNDKYIFIRGLGDRYTSTHLNGAEMPTSDPDVKAFQADLFPANILDKIVTLKSFTPDKPGNFSGGLVDIGTKVFPKNLTYSLSYSTSFNSATTFNDDYLFYKGSGSDWLGQDDGLRALPDILSNPDTSVPSIISARTNPEQAALLNDISRSFEPVMSSRTESAPLDQGVSMSFGNRTELFGKDLGFLATLTYSRKRSFYDNWQSARWKLTEGADVAETLVNQSNFIGEQGKDKVNWGGLITANYAPHYNHSIGFNFIYTQGGESTSQYYLGQWPEQFSSDNAFLESRLLKYSERNLTSFQFRGEHYFPELGDWILDWTASFSGTEQDEPDTRIFTDNFSIRTINGEQTAVYGITPSIYNNPARYFRNLQEDSTTFNMNLSIPFHQWNGLEGKIKVGGSYDEKARDFTERRFEYVSESNIRYEGDPESFFGLDNVGVLGYDEQRNRYVFGNVLQNSPDSRGGNYNGDSEITAAYAMLELPLGESLKMIAGARMEQADFLVSNASTNGILDDDDLLPSLHFIQNVGDNTNLRFSYGRTLARPNFREKAPYASYDFIADGIFVGNPDLKRTLIDNYDFRWEWFPRGGELIAASAFYKEFENPIERSYNIRQASEFGEKTFLNVPEATVYGIELELRKNLDAISLGNGVHVFSLAANLSLIESRVDIPEEEFAFIQQRNPDADRTRTLQGQSPYLVNFGFNYDNFSWGTSASIFYNVFGERLDEVGYGGAPDALEQPRQIFDLTLSQPLWQNFSLKIAAKNLLDDPVQITQEFKGQEYVRSEYRTGRTYSLSISFKP